MFDTSQYTLAMGSSSPTTDILRDCIQFYNRYSKGLYSVLQQVFYGTVFNRNLCTL